MIDDAKSVERDPGWMLHQKGGGCGIRKLVMNNAKYESPLWYAEGE